jgi:hypothetical protein
MIKGSLKAQNRKIYESATPPAEGARRLSHQPNSQGSSAALDVTKVTEVAAAISGHSGWPGDWYVYEDGAVRGPLSAEDAFGAPRDPAKTKQLLVSRKGFSQWYPLGDLSEIFRLTAKLGRLSGETAVNAQLERYRAASTRPHLTPPPPRSKAAEPARAEVKSAAAPMPVVKPKPRADKPASLAQPFSAPEPVSMRQPSSVSRATTVDRDKEATAPASRQARVSRHDVMTEYFLQRGRMRLGKIRQAWLAGFIGLPLSLGLYWLVWFKALAEEAVFHTQAAPRRIPPFFLAAIPLVHVFMVYRLATLVRGMEEQNKYRTVNPALAAVYALIPPFAMTYLQDAANRHWLLHARHAAVRRAEDIAS